ncbi:MAG: 2Fe-2S iron-sulfur cluster-binding protein [Acidimicrobiia bacterium]|nr:2Fe-2S iron-sulfur cluster-binding protein [Acidimicrobiia bacterium]
MTDAPGSGRGAGRRVGPYARLVVESLVTLTVNGREVTVDDGSASGRPANARLSLLDVLREQLGLSSVKDGCSPQGQCGCCTVLVDGQPRVACVTPARRVRGRTVTTLEGLEERDRWAEAFCATGASQCGFCTPGIIMRLAGTDRERDTTDIIDPSPSPSPSPTVNQALLAHLCRCTGWQTIGEAWDRFHGRGSSEPTGPTRDLGAAAHRAAVEGGAVQMVGPDVALGHGGFAADTAPADALVAVRSADGSWVVAESVAEARVRAGKVQGRRTTAAHRWPLEVPPGDWDVALRTTWVDPAYLETDASWCAPGGAPYTTVANGGAFGAKVQPGGVEALDVAAVARRLADEHDHPVLVLASREDVARFGAKRPPVAAGINPDLASFRIAATTGVDVAVEDGLRAAGFEGQIVVELVDVPGPPTSASVRAAGSAEARVLLAGFLGRVGTVRSPSGGEAEAEVDPGGGGADPVVRVAVRCGPILDAVVLRSYCIGAAHMAWSWLTSEALAVDESGDVHDLTIRSFGVLRAVDTPRIEVELIESDGEPVNGSDAVFVAVAASGWLARGCRTDWPIGLDPG